MIELSEAYRTIQVIFKIEEQKREKCYVARDLYYQCKFEEKSPDKISDIINNNNCSTLLEDYHSQCPKTWIKYWEERVKRGQPLRTPGGRE